ncbi:MAG TPA: COX15/CtaA family protein [Rhizomicrobium sp.]|nr:COX15/CtaA family protein [Rhizomicrobium sp.]
MGASRKAVGIWLLCVAALIICMVILGGLTRLTGSGLSITQWQPVTGVVPPMSETAWTAEFERYQHIPPYRLEHRGMSLDDFKAIYWWEWTHRLLGRAVGIVFFVPFLWFAWRGAIGVKDIPRMALLFALGGLQGFIGWWMVQSGLETRVSVSQYRLAIHLGAAVFLLGAILWTALEYLRRDEHSLTPTLSLGREEGVLGCVFVGLVYVQMLLGALVAGLHAGLLYNTWPSMDGRFVPEDAFVLQPLWRNFFENPGMVQFDHRIGAYIVALCAFAMWFGARRNGIVKRSATAALHITLLQIVLGITTLLMQAPIILSALHQLTAALLFCAAVWHAFETRYEARA